MIGYGSSPLETMAQEAMLCGLVYLDDFTYSASFQAGTSTALAANGQTDVQVQINSDSDFIAQEWNQLSWSAAGTIIASPDFLITVIRAGSGRELFNQPQPLGNICGNYFFASGNNPGRRPMPSLFQGNNTITVRLQNRTASAPNRVDISFSGMKVFYQTSQVAGPYFGKTGNRQAIFHSL